MQAFNWTPAEIDALELDLFYDLLIVLDKTSDEYAHERETSIDEVLF